MSDDLASNYLTTRELAALLRIKERKVYDLAAAGEVPCSRATGKLLFPRKAVELWLARSSTGLPDGHPRTPVFAGSHDPLLEWALRESRANLATFFDGSLDGVERFAAGHAIATGLHVLATDTQVWNVDLVAARFAAAPVVLMEFAWRQRGLIVAAGRESELANMASLRGLTLVARQPEAGSQGLARHLLAQHGLDDAAVRMTAPVRTEIDAALAVAEGKADAALGLQGLARQYRLGFTPLVRERFDLLIDRRAWFDPPLQRFAKFCRSAAFQRRAEELQGYEVADLGQVHFNGA